MAEAVPAACRPWSQRNCIIRRQAMRFTCSPFPKENRSYADLVSCTAGLSEVVCLDDCPTAGSASVKLNAEERNFQPAHASVRRCPLCSYLKHDLAWSMV